MKKQKYFKIKKIILKAISFSTVSSSVLTEAIQSANYANLYIGVITLIGSFFKQLLTLIKFNDNSVTTDHSTNNVDIDDEIDISEILENFMVQILVPAITIIAAIALISYLTGWTYIAIAIIAIPSLITIYSIYDMRRQYKEKQLTSKGEIFGNILGVINATFVNGLIVVAASAISINEFGKIVGYKGNLLTTSFNMPIWQVAITLLFLLIGIYGSYTVTRIALRGFFKDFFTNIIDIFTEIRKNPSIMELFKKISKNLRACFFIAIGIGAAIGVTYISYNFTANILVDNHVTGAIKSLSLAIIATITFIAVLSLLGKAAYSGFNQILEARKNKQQLKANKFKILFALFICVASNVCYALKLLPIGNVQATATAWVLKTLLAIAVAFAWTCFIGGNILSSYTFKPNDAAGDGSQNNCFLRDSSDEHIIKPNESVKHN